MSKQFYFKQLSLTYVHSFKIKTVLFQTIHFSISVVYWPPAKPAIAKTAEVLYSVGVGELAWQYGTGLKSHGKVTNWSTWRGWQVNCMTVISTRWRSNMPFQRRRKCIFRWPVMGRDWVGDELLYNSVHRKFNEFGNHTSWRYNAVEKTNTQRGWAPVEQPRRTGKKRWWS